MQETEVLARLVAWGEAQPLVRAMILTSSRARPDGAVDVLSDYDLILAVTDADGFAQDRAWEAGYGEPMVRWGDQNEVFGLVTYFRGIVYQDGAKIDYTVAGHAARASRPRARAPGHARRRLQGPARQGRAHVGLGRA
jgi:hypothetical protein